MMPTNHATKLPAAPDALPSILEGALAQEARMRPPRRVPGAFPGDLGVDAMDDAPLFEVAIDVPAKKLSAPLRPTLQKPPSGRHCLERDNTGALKWTARNATRLAALRFGEASAYFDHLWLGSGSFAAASAAKQAPEALRLLAATLDDELNSATATAKKIEAELPFFAQRMVLRVARVAMPLASGALMTYVVMNLPLLACFLGLATAALTWLMLRDNDYVGPVPHQVDVAPKAAKTVRPRLALEIARRQAKVFAASRARLAALGKDVRMKDNCYARKILLQEAKACEGPLLSLAEAIAPLEHLTGLNRWRKPLGQLKYALGALIAVGRGPQLFGTSTTGILGGVMQKLAYFPAYLATVYYGAETARGMASSLSSSQRAINLQWMVLTGERNAHITVQKAVERAARSIKSL